MPSKHTILIVDDEPMNLALLQGMLASDEIKAVKADNGQKALDRARSLQPDLILLDIMMPGLDGYAVTRHLKGDRDTRHIPIVLVTALNAVEDKVKGLEAGADDFLSKPVERIELMARVNSLLKVKAYHDRLRNHQQVLETEVARRTAALEAELARRKQAEAQLLQAQKMEAIGTLAGGIAHDFNNILTSVLGYTELAQEDAPSGSQLQGNLEEVIIAARRAKDLVDQILAFSRQSEQDFKPVQLKQVVSEAFRLLGASLPSSISMEQDLRSEACVMADATQLHQVLLNLCTNAVHAMRQKGGVLKIGLEEETVSGANAPLEGISPGRYLKLSIQDNGHGIPPAVMSRIFDPYFTTKAPGVGTGIGLSTVHGIVKNHRGHVTLTSAFEEGTTFYVYLPVIEQVEVSDKETTELSPTGSEHILLVDDEPPLVSLGQKALKRLGYEVTGLTDSTEALKVFSGNPHAFDLVITDMTMPQMSGIELASRMLQCKPDLPIILCTGFNASVSESEAQAQGIRALVNKPMPIQTMAHMVRAVIDGKM